jgi:hypothetical protein
MKANYQISLWLAFIAFGCDKINLYALESWRINSIQLQLICIRYR